MPRISKCGRGVGDLVALAVADDQLKLVSAGRDFFRQLQAELDVKIATAAAAAVVDVRKLAAVDALALSRRGSRTLSRATW